MKKEISSGVGLRVELLGDCGKWVRQQGIDCAEEELALYVVTRIWHTLFQVDGFYLAHQAEMMQGVAFLKREGMALLCGRKSLEHLRGRSLLFFCFVSVINIFYVFV